MLAFQILSLVLSTGITSAFLPVVGKKIAHVFRKLWAQNPDVNENLQKLGRSLLKIQSHVDDAEINLPISKAYRIIIDDFKNVLLDAEDLMDWALLECERLQSQHENEQRRRRRDIQDFVTEQLLPKIDEMQERVDLLASEMKDHINPGSQRIRSPTFNAVPQMSGSLVDVSSVVGRQNDMQQIIKLVHELQGEEKAVSVIPIVGMVGIGKTTLAQLVFNHFIHFNDDVAQIFKPSRMWWVSVSLGDDVLEITKSICEASGITVPDQRSSLDSLQMKLKTLVGKDEKFLLVLDGMCNENPIHWDALKLPFQSAAPGSVILVTTRSRIVSSIVTDSSAYCLHVLPDKVCWKIIKQSLRNCLVDDEDFEENGLQIAKKCKGIPLVAKVIGSSLRLKLKEMDWNAVLDCVLWELEKDENHIYPALKLSYDHLPSHLKRCFAYCSLYPHGRPFQMDELIQLWVAEDFIQPRENRRMEDIAKEYFDDFCSTSFFQVSSDNQAGRKYEMHGFVHELARLVSTNLCFAIKDPLSCTLPISTDIRYLSLVCNDEMLTSGTFNKFYLYKKLRTFMLLPGYRQNLSSVPRDFFTNFPYLRVLNLSGSGITELSDNISDLILLRHLNLSSTSIQKLPKSIDQIYGLERLNVNNCFNLEELPDNLNKLIKLRHIDFDRDISMPVSVGKLTSLETLSVFLVEIEEGKKIEELREMKCLRGSLCIKQLDNVANVEEATAAMLHEKQYLDQLELQWQPDRPGTVDDQDIITCLEPHYKLKRLQVKGYCGSRFPNWMSNPSFCKLVKMDLKMCTSCVLLPSLGRLPFLKDLWIEGMDNLEVVSHEFCEVGGFPSLETLKFGKMSKWKSWEGLYEDSMPRLIVLTIESCPEFLTLPSLHYLASLRKLEINDCPQLESFPEGGLPRGSLQCLIISESTLLKKKYCTVREGQDWEMISYICQIEIDGKRIQGEGHEIQV